MKIRTAATGLSMLLFASLTFAQQDKPASPGVQDKAARPSPPAKASCSLGDGATITIDYSSPRAKGRKIGHLHLRYLNPLPSNLGDILKRYKKILVPELNMGQLLWVLRAKYLVDAVGLNKIQGRPFKQAELEQKIEEMLGL